MIFPEWRTTQSFSKDKKKMWVRNKNYTAIIACSRQVHVRVSTLYYRSIRYSVLSARSRLSIAILDRRREEPSSMALDNNLVSRGTSCVACAQPAQYAAAFCTRSWTLSMTRRRRRGGRGAATVATEERRGTRIIRPSLPTALLYCDKTK